MKKTAFKFFLFGFTLTCFMLAGGVNSLHAQTLADSPLNNVPKGPFVLPANAVTILDAELVKLKTQMGGLQSNTPQYKQANWQYVYYEHMIRLLVDIKTGSSEDVARAIVRGLGIYATDLYGDIPQQQKVQNKAAAEGLLKA